MAGMENITDENLRKFYQQMQQTYEVLDFTGLITETVKIMLSLLAITADILTIVIIKRCSKLKSKTDRFTEHYAIWHIIFLAPFYVIIEFSVFYEYLPLFTYYILYEIERMGFYFTFCFALGLEIEWLLNIYNPKLGESINVFNKYLFYFIYSVGSLFYIAELCFSYTKYNNYWKIKSFAEKTFYYSILLITLVFNYLKHVNKANLIKRHSYGLIMANAIVFLCLPLNIYEHLLGWTYGHYIIYSIVLYTIFLPEWLFISTSLIVVVILIRFNEHFGKGFWGLLQRPVKNCNYRENVDENEQFNQTIPSGEVYL